MTCPRCDSSQTRRRARRTSLGYRTFACRSCHRIFNERTGSAFNDLQYPTDIVLVAVLWRLRYKLGFRGETEYGYARPVAIPWTLRIPSTGAGGRHGAAPSRYADTISRAMRTEA